MAARKSEVLESPQTSIGAQELICIGNCSKSGFLRKQGSLERLFKFLRWRQRFIILSKGCIYIFKDELSARPKFAFSLKLFLRMSRLQDGAGMRWSFNILPTDERRGKTLMFACISENERKEWMKSLKAEMLKAHKITEKRTNEKLDEYVYLEKAVALPKPAEVHTAAVQDISEDPDDLGGEKDYDTIEDSMIGIELPVTVAEPKKTDIKKKVPKVVPKVAKTLPPEPIQVQPKVKKKAATLPTAVSRSTFEYKGTDRAEVDSLLIARPEGTYLVRKSRQDGKEVLSVNIEGILKEFKIYTKDGQATINNTEYFPSVEELIQYYVDHPLPNKSAKLYRAYTVVDPRYIN